MEVKYPIYLRLSLITTLLLSAALTGTRAPAVEIERSEDRAGSPAADRGRPRLLPDPSLAGSALHLNSSVVVSDLSAPVGPQAAPVQPQAKPAKKDTFSAVESDSSQASIESAPASQSGEAPIHFSFSGGQAPAAASSEDTFHFVRTAPSAANSAPVAPSVNIPFVSMTDPHVDEARPQPVASEDAPFSFRAPASVSPMSAPLASPLASNEPVAATRPENSDDTPYRFK